MKYLLSISIIVSIITYIFWPLLPKGSFYMGNSLFILLICSFLFFEDKKNNVKFVLFALSVNNFLDEIIFDNTKLQVNELIFAFLVLLILIYRIRNGSRKKCDRIPN